MILCVLLFFVYVLYYFVERKRARKKKFVATLRLPPVYPGALPIIGNAHMTIGDQRHLYRLMDSISKECLNKGGVILYNVGLIKYYVITDPDDFISAANGCLQKHFSFEFLKQWLGNGLFSGLDLKIWKRHRKLFSPSFSQQVLDGFLVVFNNQSRKLVEKFADKVGNGPFDHSHYVDQESLENICKTSFGMMNDEPVFDETFYMKSIQKMLGIVTKRMQKFWLHFDFIYNLTALKRKQDKVVKYLNDTCEAVLQRKRENLQSERSSENISGKEYKAFIDLAFDLCNEGILTNKEVEEEINTLILAGYETTGNAMLYTLLLLGSHSRVQEKAYEEIMNVFGATDRNVERDDLSKLVYLEAIVKESLRLFSVTPVILRHVNEDFKLKEYTMPAGSNCMFFVHGLHRHKIWGPDADQFRPERWLDPEAVADPKSALYKAFAGFGIGRRLCLGKTFAMMSMKTTICHLLRRYIISSDISNLELKLDPLLKPVSGHEITLEYRK